MTTKAWLDIQKIVRNTIRKVGYTNSKYGLDAESCSVLSSIHEQSSDIAQGVNKGQGLFKDLGAGDQGLMFGYACRQTPSLMPLPIFLAHQLLKTLSTLRKNKTISYLRPDSKAQVTVKYEGRQPVGIHTIVLSTQHDPDVSHEQLVSDIKEAVIRSSIPSDYLDEDTRYLINPTGRFVTGGPQGDTGLTGRKIIVDTYGGWAKHGGGAFSGKDPTKVDRSAAYMARYIAKHLVAAGIAEELELQLAYAIGVSEPVSIHVDTKGKAKLEEEAIVQLIRQQFDLTPEGIIRTLNLKQPIYEKTAVYGHFGREDSNLSWENLDKVNEIKECLKQECLVF